MGTYDPTSPKFTSPRNEVKVRLLLDFRLIDTMGSAKSQVPLLLHWTIEKEFVEQELANAALSPISPPGSLPGDPAPVPGQPPISAADVAVLVRKAVEDALTRHASTAGDRWAGEQQMAQVHIADLTARLAAAERALSDTRIQAAHLTGELQAAQEIAERAQAQLDAAAHAAKAQRDAHTLAMSQVTAELDEIRKFAMRVIDDVRGETRAERDRRLHAESALKTNEKMLELFRQMAYQRGGAIPPELRTKGK